jgi:hypothetical protein
MKTDVLWLACNIVMLCACVAWHVPSDHCCSCVCVQAVQHLRIAGRYGGGHSGGLRAGGDRVVHGSVPADCRGVCAGGGRVYGAVLWGGGVLTSGWRPGRPSSAGRRRGCWPCPALCAQALPRRWPPGMRQVTQLTASTLEVLRSQSMAGAWLKPLYSFQNTRLQCLVLVGGGDFCPKPRCLCSSIQSCDNLFRGACQVIPATQINSLMLLKYQQGR